MARTEIVGGNALSKTVKVVKKAAGLPLDIVEVLIRRSPKPNKSWFIGNRTEIVGDGDCLGEEERELAREGGSSERAAANRRLRSSIGFNGHTRFIRPDTVVGLTWRQAHVLRKISRNPMMLSRVQQRANQGDVRAQQLLAAYQARVSAAQTTVPYGTQAPYASPWPTQQYQQPTAPSTPTANVYYPAQPSYADQSEYDYSGADDKTNKLAAIIKPALTSKKISRIELSRAAAASAGEGASSSKINAAKEQITAFLSKHGVKVA
jgi:hypothetical protein